jgi:hypothetical protein
MACKATLDVVMSESAPKDDLAKDGPLGLIDESTAVEQYLKHAKEILGIVTGVLNTTDNQALISPDQIKYALSSDTNTDTPTDDIPAIQPPEVVLQPPEGESNLSIHWLSDVASVLVSGEFQDNSSEFYEADIRIRENQAVTRQIRQDTGEELKKLAELVSEL